MSVALPLRLTPAKARRVVTENLTEPLKATTQTSYFKTFVLCALLGPALVLAWLWLGRKVLDPQDAESFKTVVLGVWSLLTGGSGGASLWGGLARTFGKTAIQKAQALSETTSFSPAPGADFPAPFDSGAYNLDASVGDSIHRSKDDEEDIETFDLGDLPEGDDAK